MNNIIDQMIVDFTGKLNEKSIRDLKVAIFQKAKKEEKAIVLVSLKTLVHTEDPEKIKEFIAEIEKSSIKLGVRIYFVDYPDELFIMLKKNTVNTGISLYKNKEVAALFLVSKAFDEDTKVLVYDEDEQNSKQLYFKLCSYGYEIDRAPNMDEFLLAVDNDLYDIVVSKTQLNKRASKSQKTLALSKKLIVNLPVFMNQAVDTLISFTELDAHKVMHQIQKFDTTLEVDCICAVMDFRGEIEGSFTLVFPRNLAAMTLESLLKEDISLDDNDALTDGVAEFCNIITGAVKTKLDQEGIEVVFELPEAYITLDNTEKHIGTNNGVWMEMELSGKPFYMFITK